MGANFAACTRASFSKCTCSHNSSSLASTSLQSTVPTMAPSIREQTILQLWLIGTQLRASATLLSAPFWYSNANSKEANVATHLCPVASRLGVVRTYVYGLLSVLATKGVYARYSLKCSVTLHFRPRNSSLELW